MQAITSGKIAAGMAMAKEFQKYGAMPLGMTLPPVMTSL